MVATNLFPRSLNVPVIYDSGAVFGTINICGTTGQTTLRFGGPYTNFQRQLVSFVEFIRSGTSPYPFADTIELMALLIAGLSSRAENSRRVDVAEIIPLLSL